MLTAISRCNDMILLSPCHIVKSGLQCNEVNPPRGIRLHFITFDEVKLLVFCAGSINS